VSVVDFAEAAPKMLGGKPSALSGVDQVEHDEVARQPPLWLQRAARAGTKGPWPTNCPARDSKFESVAQGAVPGGAPSRSLSRAASWDRGPS
jgi:hypothetical protein